MQAARCSTPLLHSTGLYSVFKSIVSISKPHISSYINPISMIKVPLDRPWLYVFYGVKILKKFAYFMQIFQEKCKKTWFSTRNMANFQKIFMPNCSPSIFTYPYVLISKPEKNFFPSIFWDFLGRKKFFSGFFQENRRNHSEIII